MARARRRSVAVRRMTRNSRNSENAQNFLLCTKTFCEFCAFRVFCVPPRMGHVFASRREWREPGAARARSPHNAELAEFGESADFLFFVQKDLRVLRIPACS